MITKLLELLGWTLAPTFVEEKRRAWRRYAH